MATVPRWRQATTPKAAAPVHRLDRLGPMPAVTLVAPPAEACVVEVGSVRVHVILSQAAFVPIASGAVLEGARTAGDVPSAAVVPPTDLEACRLGRGVHELAAPTPVEVKFADRRVGDAELLGLGRPGAHAFLAHRRGLDHLRLD